MQAKLTQRYFCRLKRLIMSFKPSIKLWLWSSKRSSSQRCPRIQPSPPKKSNNSKLSHFRSFWTKLLTMLEIINLCNAIWCSCFTDFCLKMLREFQDKLKMAVMFWILKMFVKMPNKLKIKSKMNRRKPKTLMKKSPLKTK